MSQLETPKSPKKTQNDQNLKTNKKHRIRKFTFKRVKEVVIVIGETGIGKSTLIKFQTNAKVNTSNCSSSCTSESILYPHKTDKFIWLCDTVGTKDTGGKSEHDILLEMCKKINRRGEYIKVIWMIPTSCRKNKQLQVEARFINALSKNIWNGSVAIICTKGMDEDAHQGARVAAQKYTSKTIPAFNLHVADLVKKWQTKKFYKNTMNEPLEERLVEDPIILMKNELYDWTYDIIRRLKPCIMSLKLLCFHSPQYYEEFYHDKEWSKNGWEIFKTVSKGVILGGIIAAGSAVTGGGLGVALTGASMTAGEVGGLLALGGTIGGVKGGVENHQETEKNSSRYEAWSCCGSKYKCDKGCKCRRMCIWCNKDNSENEGCKKKWVPRNYQYNPRIHLVQKPMQRN